jgi:tRNA(fMet)-specific endonuclease VapC
VIVACELRYGAAKRGSRRLTKRVEAVLGALTIRSLESDVERVYAAIRVALEKKGTPIGRTTC